MSTTRVPVRDERAALAEQLAQVTAENERLKAALRDIVRDAEWECAQRCGPAFRNRGRRASDCPWEYGADAAEALKATGERYGYDTE